MSDIDREWAISELSKFIAEIEIIWDSFSDSFVVINVGSEGEISSQAYVVDRILDVVFPNWKQDPIHVLMNGGGIMR